MGVEFASVRKGYDKEVKFNFGLFFIRGIGLIFFNI